MVTTAIKPTRMEEYAMTPLRQPMIEDRRIRGHSQNTIDSYVGARPGPHGGRLRAARDFKRRQGSTRNGRSRSIMFAKRLSAPTKRRFVFADHGSSVPGALRIQAFSGGRIRDGAYECIVVGGHRPVWEWVHVRGARSWLSWGPLLFSVESLEQRFDLTRPCDDGDRSHTSAAVRTSQHVDGEYFL